MRRVILVWLSNFQQRRRNVGIKLALNPPFAKRGGSKCPKVINEKTGKWRNITNGSFTPRTISHHPYLSPAPIKPEKKTSESQNKKFSVFLFLVSPELGESCKRRHRATRYRGINGITSHTGLESSVEWMWSRGWVSLCTSPCQFIALWAWHSIVMDTYKISIIKKA